MSVHFIDGQQLEYLYGDRMNPTNENPPINGVGDSLKHPYTRHEDVNTQKTEVVVDLRFQRLT